MKDRNKQEPPALEARRDFRERSGTCDSRFYAEVAAGRAPQPIIKRPRFTRWRKSDIDEWLRDPEAWIAANAPASVAQVQA